jgi:hypothetical protein
MQPPQPIPNSFFNQQQQNMMNAGGNAPSLTKKNTFGPAQGLPQTGIGMGYQQ